jgi:hypothetical protein
MPRTRYRVLNALTSLRLTIACLVLLMVLVVACTLAQVQMGVFGAVNAYIRSFFVWGTVPGTTWHIPVFPGGGLVGLVLTLNLVASLARRLELSLRKAGLWIVHLGLIVLFAGEFVTSFFQVETQLSVEEGKTVEFVESTRERELAVIDTTDADHDEVYAIPESLLVPDKFVEIPGTPLFLKVNAWYKNSGMARRSPNDPPSPATMGIGPGVNVIEAEPVAGDDQSDRTAAFVEPFAGPKSYGIWLVSEALGAPQSFTHG